MIPTPLSLYIHIPFCVRKCRYCDFLSVPYDSGLADRYIEAISEELRLFCKKYSWETPVIDTLFFGGGTPSILSAEQWKKLTDGIRSSITFADNYEWTIECNPDSWSDEKAAIYLQTGVNRITFGVQSLEPKELSIMGRVHSADRVFEVLSSSCLLDFNSVGVDCIYGLPGQTVTTFQSSLETLIGFPIVKHLSVYELNINEKTPFGRHQAILPLPSEDESYEMALKILELSKHHGFQQYEISNFALPGYRCRHNEIYWNHDSYIGIGVGAHSYIHPLRLADNNDIITYIRSIAEGNLPVKESETIDCEILAREMVFLGIRRSDGIDEVMFFNKTGFDFHDYAGSHKLSQLLDNNFLTRNGRYWKPTDQGLLRADAIARDLIHYENTV
jgi:oxygen-independent coproporphyrinogen-3 oxidase